MSLAERFDKYLLDQEDKNKTRVRSGLMSPSSFGQCYRRQYFTRSGEPITNPIDIETLRTFALGKQVHELLQKLYDNAQVEVEITTEDVHGFADIVEEDCVTDIKSQGKWAFTAMGKPGFDCATEKKDYVLQLATYAVILGKPKFTLAFVCKDPLEIREFNFLTKDFEKIVQTEIRINKSFWDKGLLPPADPRLYPQKDGSFKECNYCPFRNTCEVLEGKKLV